MPELQGPKDHPHPWGAYRRRLDADRVADPPSDRSRPPKPAGAYAELQVTTNFSFLRGASHPEELVESAGGLGLRAMAVTDRCSLAGVVRAHIAAKEHGVQLIVGAAVDFAFDASGFEVEASALEHHDRAGDGLGAPRHVRLLLYPTDRAAYGRLGRLLTLGKRRAPKGQCHLTIHDLLEHHAGLLAVIVPPAALVGGVDSRWLEAMAGLRRVFDEDRLSLALSRSFGPDDRLAMERAAALGGRLGVPLVATNDVRYHEPGRRMLQDVATCIRLGCALEGAGLALEANAERFLKPAEEMGRLFADCPEAIGRTVEIADRAAGFSLDQLAYRYPREVCPRGLTPMAHLERLVWRGAAERFGGRGAGEAGEAGEAMDRVGPASAPSLPRGQLHHELELIRELGYAEYFLTVYDLVVFARRRGILCQGRGAAANSAVCYCLGITSVDPTRIDVLFERFVSKARNEPPDIDIDFEHERREEVIQYIYEKYGRDRAALCAEVISYRPRSAIRDVGKALGLSLECVDRLARHVDRWRDGAIDPEELRRLGYDPDEPTMQHLVRLAAEILGFPRHLSQHVGGFVITDQPLSEMVPIENAAMEDRTVIEWDKDDIDAMGMLKVDCLGLGMLTCLSKAWGLLAGGSDSLGPLDLSAIPPEDPAVYDMVCRADTIGVFQIESRAQMSMLPRLRPRCYYDLVIEVAIVRPGPIVGDMVHPYLRRRNGEEAVVYPSAAVERILGKTLGVPLFQEQAMRLAIDCAGFTPEEADQLRRAIAAWKSKRKVIYAFGCKLVEGMLAHGLDRGFAERCFEQIKGFSEYGFPESHAASFALIVYASAWLKCHHPAAFAAALLNSQPMGFYAPAQIVRDAREHGVEVRPVDVNDSGWDCSLEPGRATDGPPPRPGPTGAARRGSSRGGPAMRLGMRLVRGLSEREGRAIAAAVGAAGPFDSIAALWRAVRRDGAGGVGAATLRRLAAADAFGSMGLGRREALWRVRALRDERLPLFEMAEGDGGKRRPSAAAPGGEASARTNEPRRGPRRVEPAALPILSLERSVLQDYATTGLSLKRHPMSFLRRKLRAMGAAPCGELREARVWPDGRGVGVAGVVLVRQRPSTASGVVFMTIEDETGAANLIFRPRVFDRFRRAARHGMSLLVRGRVERQGEVVHVSVRTVIDLTAELDGLSRTSRDFH